MASLPLAASTATPGWVTISSRDQGPRHVGRIVDPLVREDGETEPDLQLSGAPELDPRRGKQALEPPRAGASVSPDSSQVGPKPEPAETADQAEQYGDGSGATPRLTADTSPEPTAAPASNAHTPEPALDTASADAASSDRSAGNAAAPSANATELTPAEPTSPGAVPPGRGSGHPVRDKLLRRAEAARARAAGGRSANALTPSSSSEPARGLVELEGIEEPRSAHEAELERVGKPLLRPPAAPSSRSARGQLSPTMIAVFGALIGLATVASLIALVMNMDAGRQPKSYQTTAPQGSAAAKPVVKAPVGAIAKRERKKLPGPWRIVDAKGDPTSKIIEGKLGNQAFLVAVADAGIKQKEAYRLLIAYKGLRDLDNCDRNDRFRALVERGSGRLKAFEYEVSAEEVYQAREDKDGYLKATRLDLKVARHQVKGAFMHDGEKVGSSAEPAGFEKGLAKVLASALDGHMDLDELEKGDRVRVIAQEVTVLGEFARYAGIEALEVLPRDKKTKPLRIYYFHHAVAGGYYNGRGQAPFEGGWRKPIKDAPITSKFNPKRLHPVLKKVMPHNGTDFGAPTGTPVGASSYGTVSFVGVAGASGNLVKVDHPGGIETGYAHLSRFAEGLKVGDRVKRLQLVGYVGSTGRSTGPHLHFSAKKDGVYIDPESLNLDGMRVINLQYRGEFERIKVNYDKLLDQIPLPPLPVEPEPAVLAKAEAQASEDEAFEADDELMGFDEAGEEPSEQDAVGSAEPARMAAPARAASAAAPPGGPAVYLTDKELLEMQGGSDDGEVDE